MTIIEQARELLALAECAEGSDGAAWAAGNTLERRAPEAIAALCRALIERDAALRELVNAEDALDSDPSGGACDRYKSAYRAARRALAEPTGHSE